MNQNQKMAMEIGGKFASMLNNELGENAMTDIRQKNRVENMNNEICASHDHTDANMVMLEAYEDVTKTEWKFAEDVTADEDEKQNELWGAAWNYAFLKHLSMHSNKYSMADVVRYRHRMLIYCDVEMDTHEFLLGKAYNSKRVFIRLDKNGEFVDGRALKGDGTRGTLVVFADTKQPFGTVEETAELLMKFIN